jgi:cytochrome c peroxidase
MAARTILACFMVVSLIAAAGNVSASELTAKEKLGKNLFLDMRLSHPAGQACAACHSPGAGFNGIGDANISVYEGAVDGRFGNRNPPSAAYASFSPIFHYDVSNGMYVGGQFWDGRAATLADQAKGPFLNPVEQNNSSKTEVVAKVIVSNYVDLFVKVYGFKDLLNADKAYNDIADAIAAYENTAEVNKFSSKYDWYLKDQAQYPLSAQEKEGLDLFNTKGKCAGCHPAIPGPYADKPLFTDYTYDNLGVPKNTANPWYIMPMSFNPLGASYIDYGLGAIVNDVMQNGKFKVPTLRNVVVAPPYSHNGYFKTLKEIVHFYNTRDIAAENWPPPEVSENVNKTELGNLGLTSDEEDAIVAFLMTLTDGYAPPNPR